MLAIFGIALFLPAGTLKFFQAWVFLAIFAGCGAVITGYLWTHDPKLLERRMSAGPTAEKGKSQKLIMSLANFGMMALLVIPGLDHRWSWSHVPTAIAVFGDFLIIASGYLVFFVFRENSFASGTVEIAKDQRVISTGPYSIVRHPMYTGVVFWLIGTPLALGSYWGLPAIVVMMPVLAWRLLNEERFLAKHLPGYVEYQKTVRYRLIPFVW
ncbi:MAG TPA: isoprenylcysteine carboxylmethyltransferase family protein [Stellaceae bacterium]|nr:isoprenylcysteine carboxylmethyltransferase family protein [Stellaceae bacterium]